MPVELDLVDPDRAFLRLQRQGRLRLSPLPDGPVDVRVPGLARPVVVDCISDTHMRHEEVALADDADILVHAGDMTLHGDLSELARVARWLGQWRRARPGRAVVVVPGNHDEALDPASLHGSEEAAAAARALFEEAGLHLLIDASLRLQGLHIFGSPTTPAFGRYAFQQPRRTLGWSQVPPAVDLLITHGPPAGVGDRVRRGHAGDVGLLLCVLQRRPRVHVCGHIHEGAGQQLLRSADGEGATFCINASTVDPRLRVRYSPRRIRFLGGPP